MTKQWGMEQYKGFWIDSSASAIGSRTLWDSHGIILRPGRLGSIVEVRRIKGPVFGSKEAAEEHALQFCKEWIDKRLDPSQSRR